MMNRLLRSVLPIIWIASPLLAQEKARISPHETITENVEGDQITIVYGRPSMKDPKSGATRKIWGGLVPYGKVWRLGADEATLLTTEKDINIRGRSVPAGTYSLFLLPSETGATLILNKQTGQWGTKYDEAQDLVRVDLKKSSTTQPVEQFTITIERNDGKGGQLKLAWENTSYWVLFSADEDRSTAQE